MPLPNIPKAQFPNVPIAAGVPPLLRDVGAIQNNVVLLVSDAAIIFNHFQGPKWGLFDQSRNPVIVSDSVIDVAYRQETRISTAPQENGAFMAYNKVGTPFDARVTFAKSGTEQERQAFLNQIAAAQASLDLYILITPTISYPNVNLIHYDYRRSIQHGTQLLTVDVWLEQVRVIAGPAFSNTASPTGADAANNGQVQTQAPSSDQTSSLPSGGEAQQGSQGAAVGNTDLGGQQSASANTTVGQPSEPYYNAQHEQIGIAPSNTPASGPIVGEYANGQPVTGGDWQNGFYNANNQWVHP